jgi:hypothetical protein
MTAEGPRDNARILMELRAPLSELISLDELRLCITPADIHGAIQFALATKSPSFQIDDERLRIDPFAACVMALASASLMHLYVAERGRNCAYRIWPHAIREPHPCWSPFEAIRHGRLIAKSALLLCHSIEAQNEGQSIYASRAEAKRAFRIRPTSERTLREAIEEVVRSASEQNLMLRNEDIRALVRKNPKIRNVSDRQIDELAREIKPPEWTRPGPRSRNNRRG